MKYGVFSRNEWIYPDGDPLHGKEQIDLVAAQDSIIAAQILCDAKHVNWQWIPDENQFLEEPQVNQLISVYVDRNTAPVDTGFIVEQGTPVDHVTRLAPFDVFDAMEPLVNRSATAAEGQCLGLYLRWSTDNKPAGLYHGKLVLLSEDGSNVIIPVQIKVYSVRVPKAHTLRIVNWFSLENMALYHGVNLWSEDHWKMIEEYGNRMAQLHQTDFWVPVKIIECKQNKDGSYTFDFSRAERLIRLYLSLGMKYINGGMLYYRINWSYSFFVLDVCGVQTRALSDDGYRYAQAFFTQWYSFLQKNGWFDITQQHVGDEPNPSSGPEYRILSGMIRKWMPGIKTMEAVEFSGLDGAVDVWIPKSLAYIKEKDIFDKKRSLGDTFWYYTSCFPGGEYLNRLLDMELIRTRYIHWANQLYDFTGFLHWGLNMYHRSKGGVFTGACKSPDKTAIILPPGDSHIVYPKGKQVLISARYEMMRAGCEDYELLAMLKENAPEVMKEILLTVIRSFTDYNLDIDAFNQAYTSLLEKLEELSAKQITTH